MFKSRGALIGLSSALNFNPSRGSTIRTRIGNFKGENVEDAAMLVIVGLGTFAR
jgi:hypothetical protein